MSDNRLNAKFGDTVLLTHEEFLKYNHLELITIAIGKTAAREVLNGFPRPRGDDSDNQSSRVTFQPEQAKACPS